MPPPAPNADLLATAVAGAMAHAELLAAAAQEVAPREAEDAANAAVAAKKKAVDVKNRYDARFSR